jgi:hypothetical protein
MTSIKLPDQQAAALHAKAAALGLTLEAWLKQLADEGSTAKPSLTPQEAAARIFELQKNVKPDPEGWTVRDYINYGRR